MAGKRGDGEGTIWRRTNGKWQGQITLPDGKRKSVYDETRQGVQRQLAALRRAIEDGTYSTDSKDQRVADYCDVWVTTHPTIRETTKEKYRSRFHSLLRDLGTVKLSALTPPMITRHYAMLLQEGKAATTVHHLHEQLHAAFKAAVLSGQLLRNPCDFARGPGLHPAEMQTWNRQQVQTFLQHAGDLEDGTIIALALTTGMRQSEVLGLQWDAVDLAALRVTVRTALHRVHETYVLNAPKSQASRRTLAIPLSVGRMLRDTMRQQEAWKAFAGDAWGNGRALVFTDQLGEPRNNRWVTIQFQRAAKTLALPVIRFHDLRHTFATLLLEEGVNIRVVSELLGHGSVAITLKTYGHVTPRMSDHAQQTIASWIVDEETSDDE